MCFKNIFFHKINVDRFLLKLRKTVYKNKLLIVALIGVYILWGATYLAIKVLSYHVPLVFMSSIRHIISGLLLFLFGIIFKHPLPSKNQIKNTCIVGFFLLVVGNALVLYSNYFIHTSGVVAVLVATTPLWLAIIEWIFNKNKKPSKQIWLGVFLGLLGIVTLSNNDNLPTLGSSSIVGILLILTGTLSWSIGIFISKISEMPASPFYSSGLQMVFSSFLLGLISLTFENWEEIKFEELNIYAWFSFIYLVFGGSVMGFTAFTYLTQKTNPVIVGTYAYVNPIIALLIGIILGKEVISKLTLIASIILILATILLLTPEEYILLKTNKKAK